MMLFGRGKVDEKIKELDAKIADSFSRVRQDTTAIYQWLNYFYRQNNEQRQLIESQKGEIAELREMLNEMPKSRDEIKQVVDAYYDYGALLERLKKIEEHIEKIALARQRQVVSRPSVRVESPVEAPQVRQATSALKEKIMRRITRNSKDYIKGMIMSMINKYGRISALQLRDMLVEEQGLCSKSSFYRLLEEIEKSDEITVISSGREKVYVSRLSKSAKKY